jgi:hypothetical protein
VFFFFFFNHILEKKQKKFIHEVQKKKIHTVDVGRFNKAKHVIFSRISVLEAVQKHILGNKRSEKVAQRLYLKSEAREYFAPLGDWPEAANLLGLVLD